MRPYSWIRLPAKFLVLVFAVFGQAFAGVIMYDSQSSLFATGMIADTEGFGEYPTQTDFSGLSLTIDQVVYQTEVGQPKNPLYPWEVEASSGPGSSNFLHTNALQQREITFGSGMAVRAFGFGVASFCGGGDCGTWQGIITEANGDVTSFTLSPLANPGTDYYGFASTVGIAEITLTPTSGIISNWGFENVSRSNVVPMPEASTVIIFGTDLILGSLILLAARRLLSKPNT
jgi:hypothetical protein